MENLKGKYFCLAINDEKLIAELNLFVAKETIQLGKKILKQDVVRDALWQYIRRKNNA
jgi:hypothetical protein